MGDITIVIGGYAFPSEDIKGETGVRVIRISDFNEKGWVNNKVVRYNGKEKLIQYEVKINDLLLAMTGGTVGKSFLVDYLQEKTLLNQRVASIRAINTLPKYLNILLKAPLTLDIINSIKNSTNDNISMKDINNFLYPLPPLAEQQRIVEKIEELIPHIELYGKAQTELDTLNKNIKEQLKKSVLQYAIEGKLVPQDETEGTAEELLLQIQKEKQKLYEENKLKKKDLEHSTIFKGEDNKYYEKIGKNVICIDEEIPFEIPKDWRWCRVSNISQSYIGLTYRPEEIKKEGVIVLRSSNIKDGKIVLQDIVRVSKEIPDKLLVKENDIIICARNGSQKLVGKSALIEKIVEPTTFGAFMAICKTPFYKYMYLFLQSNCFFSQLKNVSGTTTINQLTQSSLNNFLIPLPPLPEQQRIVESIDAIFRCIEN